MINKDPFGGVSSELESNSPSPFKIDKEEALKQILKSLELWDQKKVKKKSFLQKLRKKNKSDDNIKAPHWEYSKKSRDYVNIHLLWSRKIIRSLSNVPLSKSCGVECFQSLYSQISSVKQDLSNPDILSFIIQLL